MSIDSIRKNILRSIIELYQNTGYYDKLLELIANGENIADLLKGEAVVYHLLMSRTRLIWNGDCAYNEYGEFTSRYQRGYQLYIDFVYYFLGAKVVYPSLGYLVDENLKDLSLLFDDHIDYKSFLDDIPFILERKSA